MRILALDTSTSSCSVALWLDGHVVAQRFEDMARGQSEALVPMMDDVLSEAGLRAEDMDLLAVTTGPGAFTGVRIGLATARGLALAINRPLVGISTFDALVHGVPVEHRTVSQYLCVIDTKRGDVFFQAFDGNLQRAGEARVASCEDILAMMVRTREAGDVMLVGDGAAMVLASEQRKAVDGVKTYAAQPHAAVVADIASRGGLPDKNAPAPGPVYLRPPEVKLSPHGGRLRV